MRERTRDQLLESAKRLFASRGYDGASLANIADELGVTKQALLHHFGSKDALYGAVLATVGEGAERWVRRAREETDDPARQLEEIIVGMWEGFLEDPHAARLVVREMLDIERRGRRKRSWYLKPFLDELAEITRRIAPPRRRPGAARSLALVYPLLGMASYVAISEPVLGEMYGASTWGVLEKGLPGELRAQVRRLVDALR